MSDTQVEKLLKLVKDLRNQIDGQQGTSSPNKRFKGDSFINKAQALIELQNKLGFKFKDEGLLKRALDLFSEGWDNDHCIFKILGKSVMQTCVYYHLVKEDSKISKGNLQTSLSEFFGGREYGKEARGLGLEAFVRGPSSNCRCTRGNIHIFRSQEVELFDLGFLLIHAIWIYKMGL
ncbi:hypothetical protein SUGI_0313320 [Cryptomeria japonica]|nr:hypothetical protein SUGI_0313320 [Cryptomeria japonica]